MSTIKILGIHSSPVKEGNTAHLLAHALQAVGQEEGVTTEAIALKGLTIADCTQCNWCMTKQTPVKPCAIEDDATGVLNKMRDCDILVLATPVNFARLSGTMACLIDRSRCFTFGRQKHQALKGKVGVALAVGWARNGGIETTLESIHSAFLLHEMWTPSVHAAGAIFGVGAVAGKMDEDGTYTKNRLAVMEDKPTLAATAMMMKKAVEAARMLKSAEIDPYR